MTEHAMQKRIVERALRPIGAYSVFNPRNYGSPDVDYAGGKMELKQLPDYPARKGTKIRVDHFRPEQIGFILDKVRFGHIIHVLLHIEKPDDWYLLPGEWAARNMGPRDGVTVASMKKNSEKHWLGGLDEGELCAYLISHRENFYSHGGGATEEPSGRRRTTQVCHTTFGPTGSVTEKP